MPEKVYLGDSVYAAFDGFNIVLTTETGLGSTNEIFLDPQVMAGLIKYRDKVYHQVKEGEKNNG